jgi:membrane associated rhomboid family serine protease
MPEPLLAQGDSRPPRERAINLPGVMIVLITVMVVVHAVRVWVLDEEWRFTALLYGSFIPAVFSGDEALAALPDWLLATTPFSYAFLHGSWTHPLLNALWLAVFGAPLAARIGAGRFLLFFLATAGLAALAYLAVHWGSLSPMIGASGAVSACTAAAARFAFRVRGGTAGFSGQPMGLSQTFQDRNSLTFIIVWFAVNLAAGVMSPQAFGLNSGSIAWEAHVGGFVAGLILLPVFVRPARHSA